MIFIDTLSGINEYGLDKLILDIYNSRESVHKIFDNINNLVEQTTAFYISNSGDEFRTKFNNFKINFDIINNNLLKYIDELTSVKLQYQDLSFDISNNIKTKADDISDEFK